jgi:hypothetical protein
MLELDSDQKDFKTELDRIQVIEQTKPNKQRISKTKRTKKSTNNSKIPKSFLSNESSSDLTDGLVVQIYLSIVEARNIPQISNNSKINKIFFVEKDFLVL